jgi:hypothetical protein
MSLIATVSENRLRSRSDLARIRVRGSYANLHRVLIPSQIDAASKSADAAFHAVPLLFVLLAGCAFEIVSISRHRARSRAVRTPGRISVEQETHQIAGNNVDRFTHSALSIWTKD